MTALTGCGSGGPAAGGTPSRVEVTATGSAAPFIQVPALPTPAPSSTTSAAPPPAPAATAAPKQAAAPPDLLVDHLAGIGSARQVVSVTASGYGTSYATFQAFTEGASGWTRTFGPWTARIGRQGFAPPGQKREGDLRTPTGAYGFSFFFGVNANPGVKYAYRSIDSAAIVWDDDPASANYNQWIDTRTGAGAGASPEPMHNVPVYDYGAVIAYNTARTPGLGSAIFLHQNGSGSTAGCVSLPQSQLLAVLRWLDPAASPVIVMGTTAAVSR